MMSWMSLGFQDSSSLSMMQLSGFHDHTMVIMLGVLVLICYMFFFLFLNFKFYKNLSEGTFIEIIWSVVPAFLLIVLVIPSMKVLYYMEDIKVSDLSFKIVAHQWYWSYIIPLYKNFFFKFNNNLFFNYEYDSIMNIDGYPRLLEASSDLVLPLGKVSRLMISSVDVIHSFAVPSLGLKVDALPGRINQLFVNPLKLGLYYGQCSEICGSNHSFMPISVVVVSEGVYDDFTFNKTLDLLVMD
uniref:Cytochrome c oxidase subunit 2 n=1 Tax=Myocoptes musculinus TaxID=1046713 RepID=A0A0Y0AI00_9ACAR|nr:cytochrome c oxidase subunit II [Myocoptes musculinus]